MAPSAAPAAAETLKYTTLTLKVAIHCEGCRREVKKAMQSIEGVYTTSVDPQQSKLTVVGDVGAELLIRKLSKLGKHAELWREADAGRGAGKGNTAAREQGSKEKDAQSETQMDEASPAEPPAGRRQRRRRKRRNRGEAEEAGEESVGGLESFFPMYLSPALYGMSYSVAQPAAAASCEHHLPEPVGCCDVRCGDGDVEDGGCGVM